MPFCYDITALLLTQLPPIVVLYVYLATLGMNARIIVKAFIQYVVLI